MRSQSVVLVLFSGCDCTCGSGTAWDYVGGPMYYIKNGLSKNWHFLAVLFSAFGVLTVFGTGNATQVNTITTAINSALLNFHVISQSSVGTTNLIIGIIVATED